MSDDESEWKPDEKSKARVAAELARIDAAQAGAPRCRLCGQRARRLDEFGLCSKVSVTHRRFRETGRVS